MCVKHLCRHPLGSREKFYPDFIFSFPLFNRIVVCYYRVVISMMIKRRLFLSNILMIALPVVLTITMFLTVASIYWGITGTQKNRFTENRVTYVYDNKAAGILDSGEFTQITDKAAVYRSDTRGYVIVFPGDTNMPQASNPYADNLAMFLFNFLMLIAVVYLINWILTHYIFRSIMTPINILVDGVHQIRDGNLTYRIQYNRKDEFSAICSDFNEMADKLLDMVNARQRDETNRRELIAGISHDLCTPLTSIKTYVEGIELGLASTPQRFTHYLDTIKSKTKDLEHIINQLFLFSKIDVGEFPMQMEKIDIGGLLSSYIQVVSEEYKQRSLQINLLENTQGVMACVDSVQLRNVLSNVLDNAVKYGDKEQGVMDISCRAANGRLTITLSDNGPGVPSDKWEKLFLVFYRGDEARTNTSKGSGLGLAISAKIMERFNGVIQAGNSPRGGLTISLTLPVQGEEEK